MAHRVYRFSISPLAAPEVRRVVDLDGRSSLQDLHAFALQSFGMPHQNLYAFSMTGSFDDEKSVYVGRVALGQPAERALLFRLGLQSGKTFTYLLDAGFPYRFSVTVVQVTEAARALAQPVLVESVGTPPVLPDEDDEDDDEAGDDEAGDDEAEVAAGVAELEPLAEAFLDAHDELEAFDEELTSLRARLEPWEHDDESSDHPPTAPLPSPEAVAALQTAAASALSLLPALDQDVRRLLQLDDLLDQRSLAQRLLDLPLELSAASEHELALNVVDAIAFIDPELAHGDKAIVLARAGRREEALAQLDASLASAEDKALVEAKAGDTHRALGDMAAAEAYYRRSLAEATSDFDRTQATLRLVSCLIDSGRNAEANQLLLEERRRNEPRVAAAAAAAPAAEAVGRNDPCPCGSGKKYKKCHGVSA